MGRKVVDLVGVRFERLVVVEFVRLGGYGGGAVWRCRCDCGGETEASNSELRAGKRYSCGCYQKPTRTAEDLSGRRFDRLLVLSLDRMTRKTSFWRVRCDCGVEKSVSRSHLVDKSTVSCGCFAKNKFREAAEARTAKVLADGKKECLACNRVLPLEAYAPSRVGIAGLRPRCLECLADRRYQKQYGVSAQWKRDQIARQHGVCAVPKCGRVVGMRSAIDHCHESGQVRSVLCYQCNVSLGLLGEDVRRILGLAEYAKSWKQLKLTA